MSSNAPDAKEKELQSERLAKLAKLRAERDCLQKIVRLKQDNNILRMEVQGNRVALNTSLVQLQSIQQAGKETEEVFEMLEGRINNQFLKELPKLEQCSTEINEGLTGLGTQSGERASKQVEQRVEVQAFEEHLSSYELEKPVDLADIVVQMLLNEK